MIIRIQVDIRTNRLSRRICKRIARARALGLIVTPDGRVITRTGVVVGTVLIA